MPWTPYWFWKLSSGISSFHWARWKAVYDKCIDGHCSEAAIASIGLDSNDYWWQFDSRDKLYSALSSPKSYLLASELPVNVEINGTCYSVIQNQPICGLLFHEPAVWSDSDSHSQLQVSTHHMSLKVALQHALVDSQSQNYAACILIVHLFSISV